MTVNMGPQHPSTHGVLRLVLELDGETVASVSPTIGFLHTGIEKTAEQKKWQQVIPLVERMDYLGAQSNSLSYALCVEKLLGLEMPERVRNIRVLIAELQRLASHLIWLGTHAMEIGAVSMLFYAIRERELLLNINELVAGFRFFPSYFRIGGLREDLPRGFHEAVRAFLDRFPDLQVARVGGVSGINIGRRPLNVGEVMLKRALDLTVATIALVSLSPLLAAIAVAIKLDSPGPVFFRQKRYGFNQQPFGVFKFRSMRADPNAAFRQATRNDSRITRIEGGCARAAGAILVRMSAGFVVDRGPAAHGTMGSPAGDVPQGDDVLRHCGQAELLMPRLRRCRQTPLPGLALLTCHWP